MSHSPAAPTRLLVAVAHPDDETFGCGGLLLHAAAAGTDTYVVCATRGEAGEGGTGDEPLGVVRERELRRAAAVLGVREVTLLAHRDSGMSGEPEPGTLAAVDPDALAAELEAHVARVRPEVVVTLDASDGHRDHEVMRDAAVAAATAAGVPRVHLVCLARSSMVRWVEHQRAEHPDREHLSVEDVELGTPDELVTATLDVSAHRARLAEAMAEHASQDSPYDGLPESLLSDFLDTVRLRTVRDTGATGPGRWWDHRRPGWVEARTATLVP